MLKNLLKAVLILSVNTISNECMGFDYNNGKENYRYTGYG